MTASSRFFRAAFGSTAIIGCAILGVTAMSSSTYAATRQCKIINNNGLTKALAVAGSAANPCLCPPGYERRLPRRLAGAATAVCIPIDNIQNFKT